MKREQQGVKQRSLPDSFTNISGAIFCIPLPALYVAVVGGALFIVFEYLPAGRYLYVLGASPRTAELNGISAKRYVTAAFLVAGVLFRFRRHRAAVAVEAGKVRSGRNICCRRSRRHCSARPRCGRGG